MASRFSKVQQRILLKLTEQYQRAGEIGIGGGEVYRLAQMSLVQQRVSATCKDCGKRPMQCACETPVLAGADDVFLRLTPLGVEEQKRLRRGAIASDRKPFFTRKEARVYAEAQVAQWAGTKLVGFQIDNDERWWITAGTKPPSDARRHWPSFARASEPLQLETPMGDENEDTLRVEAFARSKRGAWIISRALCALEEQLDAAKSVETREVSDLTDVRSLLTIYPTYKTTQDAVNAVKSGGDEDWLNL